MNDKIREALKDRTTMNPRGDLDSRILNWLEICSESPRTVMNLMEDFSDSNPNLYRSIFRLAINDKIGFAARPYHQIQSIARGFDKRTSILFWNKDLNLYAPISEDWIVESSAPGTVNSKEYLKGLSPEELDILIKDAQETKFQRSMNNRYSCLSKEHRENLIEVFEKINIADPVYFAHSDDKVSFMTFTAIPNMPIDIVIDSGSGPKRHNCKHLTIFGKTIVAATDSMFGSDKE